MSAYDRAQIDAQQDYFENAPFACVGGLAKRERMTAPEWIEPSERDEYLRGYRDKCRVLFGEDWATCPFGWAPALTINEPPSPQPGVSDSTTKSEGSEG